MTSLRAQIIKLTCHYIIRNKTCPFCLRSFTIGVDKRKKSQRFNYALVLIFADHIPDSYRDDLLREIALMKGIGLHPNIVTMVGACTTRDPIALIMEYVPYGNLQSFLKLVSNYPSSPVGRAP